MERKEGRKAERSGGFFVQDPQCQWRIFARLKPVVARHGTQYCNTTISTAPSMRVAVPGDFWLDIGDYALGRSLAPTSEVIGAPMEIAKIPAAADPKVTGCSTG
eukprot:1560883-Rhodomonas_salina.1